MPPPRLTAAQVLIATLPRRAIYLTGKEQDKKDWLKKKEVADTIESGRWRLDETEDETATARPRPSCPGPASDCPSAGCSASPSILRA